jgi:hypothetical protein
VHASAQRADVDLESLPAPRLVDLAGVRLGVVLWGGLAVVDVWRVLGAPAYAGLGALALLAMLASVGMRPATALACAAVAWLLVDGFVVHRAGVLRWDGAADVWRLAFLVGSATLASRAHR